MVPLSLLALAGLAVAVGFALGGRRLDHVAFFAAGHRASALLAGLSGTAIGLSAFTFVGGPALLAQQGVGALWMILPAPLTGVLQCWVVGGWLVRRSPRAVSVPELFGQSFATPARPVAALLLALGCVAALAVQAKAAGVLGATLLGGSQLFWACAVCLATVAYMAAGGMRAGVWVDAAQGVAMGVVALALAALALAHAASTGALGALFAAPGGFLGSFGKLPPAKAAAWYLLFTLGTLAQPHYLQKFFLLRDERELARFPLVLTGSLMAVLTVWVGVGLAALALVQAGSLPATGDQVVPALLSRLRPGVVGLAGVGCLFAIMSTVSSLLNLAAAALTYDLPQALGRPPAGVHWARLATGVVGALGVGLGVGSERSVALLGVFGWGFFTASFLPAILAARFGVGSPGRAGAAMVAGALVCLGLEQLRPALPPGLEPGLAGACCGLLLLALPARGKP